MNQTFLPAKPVRFETAYRALDSADRAFVDDFVARVEVVALRQQRDIRDALADWPVERLTDREKGHLESPLVRSAIQDRVQELRDNGRVSVPRLIKELASMALSSVANYLDDFGMIDLTRATPEQLAAIKKVDVKFNSRTGRYEYKIELHDKPGAIDRLLKLQHAYVDEDISPEHFTASGDIAADISDDELDRMWQNESG